MLLFIDKLPFHSWIDRTRTPPEIHYSVIVPVFVTDLDTLCPLENAPIQEWALDTGSRGEGFAWRHHFVTAGLDPDAMLAEKNVAVTSVLGRKESVPMCTATIWLVSNLPAFKGRPFRMEFDPGIPFFNVPALPDPQFQRPLIGLRAMRRAGLRVEIDCGHDTLSVWTPDGEDQAA
jgi:hypothetical protein